MTVGVSEREAIAYPAGPSFTSVEELEGLAFRVPIRDLGASVIVANAAAIDYELIPHADPIQRRGQFDDAAIGRGFSETKPLVDVVIATPDEARELAVSIRRTSELRGNEGSISFYGGSRATSLIFFNTSTTDSKSGQRLALEQHVPAGKQGRIGEAIAQDKFDVVLAQAIRTTAHKAIRATLLAQGRPSQDKKDQDAAEHRAEKIAIAIRGIFFPKTADLLPNQVYSD